MLSPSQSDRVGGLLYMVLFLFALRPCSALSVHEDRCLSGAEEC
jgi:hypothetical protein